MWNLFLNRGARRERPTDSAEDDSTTPGEQPHRAQNHLRRTGARVFVFAVIPSLVFILTATTGWLKWKAIDERDMQTASVDSVRAARASTEAMLTYQPETVDKDLLGVRDRLTGAFRESFTSLANDVVIPGAKQQKISSTASVPAAASVSATPQHAVVLVFVNQTTVIASDPPSQTASCVKVTLDKVNGQWLISDFTPI